MLPWTIYVAGEFLTIMGHWLPSVLLTSWPTSFLLASSCPASLLSCLPHVLHPSCPASLLSCPAFFLTRLPFVLLTSISTSVLSCPILSCLPPVLHPFCPASLQSFFPPVLLFSGSHFFNDSVVVNFYIFKFKKREQTNLGRIWIWTTDANIRCCAGSFLPSFYPHVFSFSHLLFFQTPLLWSLVYKFKWRWDKPTCRCNKFLNKFLIEIFSPVLCSINTLNWKLKQIFILKADCYLLWCT